MAESLNRNEGVEGASLQRAPVAWRFKVPEEVSPSGGGGGDTRGGGGGGLAAEVPVLNVAVIAYDPIEA